LLKWIAIAYPVMSIFAVIRILWAATRSAEPGVTVLAMVTYSLAMLSISAKLAGSVLLWRLRKAAFGFFLAATGLVIFQVWWFVLMLGWVASMRRLHPMAWPVFTVSLAISPVLLVCVCIYIWRLTRAGVLT
jgi:hypothetical protein